MNLSELPAKKVKGVFTDLDDTLTDESKMGADTYSSLWRLKEKGYWLVVVSGRPAGWADCLMRLWPLDAMIFENGAGWMVREGKKIQTVQLASDKDRAAQKIWLQEKYDALKKEIPNLKLATDQPYRLFDYALDFAEEPPYLDEQDTEKILAFLEKDPRGTAKLSSIHVNYWYGRHTKVTACEELLRQQGKMRNADKHSIVFVGDSPNDEPLFEYFDLSVGVANVARFLPRLKHPPKFLASRNSGAGFQEIVDILTRSA